ncbi:MAG: aminotransferase class V-fold PLP-dependent enzyme [Ruminiclostridium sp.]|nr:aminotransferase class V-fold PLP-dependent enzyme [Ruminiclostridium sp.]
MNTPIHDFLEKYAGSGTVRLHMPGGKGLEYPFDITETDGADELYDCTGIIAESERDTAALYGAGATCYSCGGSTLSIQAMLAAALSITGKHRIAAGRYSHKSLVSAAVLLGFDIDWIYPGEFLGADISPDAVRAAIGADTAAVFVNSVDYLGGQSDIAAISAVCREQGVLLLADNAHGAYKVFTGDHPLTLGADMTADSAHKTLPALTGASYLHLADKSHYKAAKAAMSLFGSSSPSYLILDSLDLCARYIAERRDEALRTVERVRELKRALSVDGVTMKPSDDMRITLDAFGMGHTGRELAREIRLRGAEPEMCGERYVVLLFSTVQPERDLETVYDILRKIPRHAPLHGSAVKVIKPEKVLSPREAFFSRRETIPVGASAGRICAGITSPCPPCVPVVMPGERISEELAEMLTGRYNVTNIGVTI